MAVMENPKKMKRLIESFFAIARILNNRRLSPNQQMENLLATILKYLEVEHGSIMLLEKKKYLVVRSATRRDLLGKRQNIEDNSVATWVATHRTPLFIPDISKDKRFEARCDIYKKNSILSVPLMNEDLLVGVINVTDRTGTRDLLKEDISILLDFSSLIISAVQQQRLAKTIEQKKDILKKRNQELRREEKMRAELSKMLIHDLKGPLSEVVANLDILSYMVSEEQREFLQAAQVACERAVRMASNLVDVGKMEDGKIKLLLEDVDPKNLLEESVNAVKAITRTRNVELHMNVPGEDLPTTRLDRVMMLRVLQNLITNALGHSPFGTRIEVGCEKKDDKHLLIYVEDQGPGILPEDQGFLFEKYARLTSRHDALVGTGLGLYFSRLAVEAHGGKIEVQSTPGQGSRFYLSLPIISG